jgi:hypothetical protein
VEPSEVTVFSGPVNAGKSRAFAGPPAASSTPAVAVTSTAVIAARRFTRFIPIPALFRWNFST